MQLGKLKSQMVTAFAAVKMLHARGQLDSDLDLIREQYVGVDSDLIEDFALEDEGKGRAGTNKRKRAYEVKVKCWKLM